MWPVLFQIPIFCGLPINGYGLMMDLGFLLGSVYIKREAIRVGANAERCMDLIFYLLIAGVFGSRVIHVFVNEWDRFLHNPLVLFYIWEGGLVWYGGLLSAIGISIWFFQKHHLSYWKYTDIFVPAVSLGHGLGRLGCFLAGCCYGRPMLHSAWYSLVFPEGVHSFAPTGIPLYPTQLTEAFAEFCIFLGLLWFRKKKTFEGQLILLYLMVYSIVRAILEIFRGDLDRGYVVDPWISTSQFISIITFLTALGIYVYRSRRREPI